MRVHEVAVNAQLIVKTVQAARVGIDDGMPVAVEVDVDAMVHVNEECWLWRILSAEISCCGTEQKDGGDRGGQTVAQNFFETNGDLRFAAMKHLGPSRMRFLRKAPRRELFGPKSRATRRETVYTEEGKKKPHGHKAGASARRIHSGPGAAVRLADMVANMLR